MRLISAISLLSAIFFTPSPRTFINFPLSGYTPIVLRSSDDNPDITPVFAESPSVRRRMQSFDLSVPAQFASVNFGIPLTLRLLPFSFFFTSLICFTSVIAHAVSITPIFATFSINLSLTSHFDPNLLDGVFI